ncbi:hypothetical protein AB205_0115090 [Aquarana catesbeiana]|uniref:Uncharacterized protein n=1 Tax=Aquarana catesbeiana TaxID=8400 RepID=A0A2G9Q0Z8_AQUCT|nr:hypothetical protein AB205_0115090 [Aquarana catesbeiana]
MLHAGRGSTFLWGASGRSHTSYCNDCSLALNLNDFSFPLGGGSRYPRV